MMKPHLSNRLLLLSIAIAGLIFPNAISQAQTDSACFMQDANGNILDLSQLCGGDTPSVFQVRIKRRDARIPVIDVNFNGNQTFEMLFDTGASGIAITAQMARTLSVQPDATAIMETAAGKIQVPLGKVNSVEVGGLRVNNPQVSINENLDMGLLGHGFFGDYDVTIKENAIEFKHR